MERVVVCAADRTEPMDAAMPAALMTSLATGLALIPLVVLGNQPGHEIEYPLAVVILGGLIISTLLTLFVVPSLYLRFAKRGRGGIPEAAAVTLR
nr:efflux RND transporter permease subunit [Streptomyces sp. 846.5]